MIAAFREARPSGRAGCAHPKGGSEANEGKKTDRQGNGDATGSAAKGMRQKKVDL